MILLGVVLAAAAGVAHAVTALTGAPIPIAVLGAAQLGVPVAAATLGAQLQLLRPGESAALLLGALTIAAASGAARAWSARTPSPASDAGSLSTDANHEPKPIPGSATG